MGLALLYPNFEGVGALIGLRTRLLGFKGCRDMLGSRLVASCRTQQETVPIHAHVHAAEPEGQCRHVSLQ
jgi:hypothetical protein